jgi:D-serine deaminase-like pyridoxal phosphate-dependent protein
VNDIAKLPGVKVIGLMTHAGHSYGQNSEADCRAIAMTEAQSLLSTHRILLSQGWAPLEISVGSTPTSKFIEELDGVTEMRPGAYVFNDVSQLTTETIGIEGCAMRVYATVVSKPRERTVIIDAGSKTLTNDLNPYRKGYGFIPAYPEIVIERLSEEHGILKVPADCALEIGDVVEIIPNHCCTVTNLRDELIGLRNGSYVQTITVDARGKII